MISYSGRGEWVYGLIEADLSVACALLITGVLFRKRFVLLIGYGQWLLAFGLTGAGIGLLAQGRYVWGGIALWAGLGNLAAKLGLLKSRGTG